MSILYEWAGSVIGQPLDPDGHYGNQCVDTVDHFGQFIFGVPWQECVGGVGGANQLLDVAPDKYWQRIDYYHGFIPQQFDVLVFAGDSLNQFGHTAVTWYATDTAIDVIQQDGFAYPWKFVDGNYYSAKPAHYYTLHYSQKGTGPLLGVLRPRPEMLVRNDTINSSGSVTTSAEPIPEGFTMDQADRVIAHINGMLLGPYENGGRKDNPGLIPHVIENQRLINVGLAENRAAFAALPTRVWWGTTVKRDGKEIAVIQDLANVRTEQLGQGEVLVEISENVSPEALAALIPEAQAEAFLNALRDRLTPKEG
ncbi:CHAP domain-containing protein [Paenarthrobacter nicotinovorans]|uniref:CHAP domain-containing protein n=1 Tax=Paenarthrobacter nicotinovorans TaxID=29320 RepID=UPI00381F5BE3